MKKTVKLLILVIVAATMLILCGQPVSAKGTDPLRPLWLRHPVISPDGKNIAFVYQGQIWIVPSAGGDAWPLTDNIYFTSHPVWSPDNSAIAFCSIRNGNQDVFIVRLAGGPVKRLTYHSTKDIPMAFSRDGQTVYFTSARMGDPEVDAKDSIRGEAALNEQVYAVPAKGGRPRMVLPTLAHTMQWDKAGKRFLYTDRPAPFENIHRKHERSDAATNIWAYDTKTKKHQQLTTWNGDDANPVWSKNNQSFFWLSERSGSFNVWKAPLAGGKAEQITFHRLWPVRFLSISDDGVLAYAFGGEIWKKEPDKKPERVHITLRQRTMVGGERLIDVTSQTDEMALSPNGREMAIVARGEIFVINLDSGATRRITNTPAMERYVDFAPDGKGLLYASERNGKWEIFMAKLTNPKDTTFSGAAPFKEFKIVSKKHDASQPRYAPSGRAFAYAYDRSAIRVHSFTNGKDIEVVPPEAAPAGSGGDDPMGFVWSPDEHWLVAKTGYAKPEIELFEVGGKRIRQNISQSGFLNFRPQISQDGQIILWYSDMYGLRRTDHRAVLSDIRAAFLNQEAFDAYVYPDQENNQEQGEQSDGETQENQKAPKPITRLDTTNLDMRTVRLTPFSDTYSFFALSPDSTVLMTIAPSAPSTQTATFFNIRKERILGSYDIFASPGTDYVVDWERSLLYAMSEGTLTRYDLKSGEHEPIPFRAEMLRDVQLEAEAIFEHNWRLTAELFYDPNMHGVDWNAVGNYYRTFLPHVHDWITLSEILAEMMGELNASHQWANFRLKEPTADQTASLGLYYDQTFTGKGEKILEVLPCGPADKPGSALVPGAVILAIDDKEISPKTSIHALLNHKAGKQLLLTILPPGRKKTVTQTIIPITPWEENVLAYKRWVAKRRALVEHLSGGRLGYVHIREMNLASYQEAIKDVFGRYRNAEGLVVDIRDNAGGDLHNQLISMLQGKHYAKDITRKGLEVGEYPRDRFGRPSVVITNACSYSDGSIFPSLYQQEGIGLLVGDNVPGTGTAIFITKQLEPSLSYTIPFLGYCYPDGTFYENREIKADVLVRNEPNSLTQGRDKQLETAVRVLLKSMDKKTNNAKKQ